jgi:hypothetical protein
MQCCNISCFTTLICVLFRIARDANLSVKDVRVRSFNVVLVAHFKIPWQNKTQVQAFPDG